MTNQPPTQRLRVIVLLGIVIVCVAYFVLSFHPRARFSNPEVENFPRSPSDYHCYHDRIYGHTEPVDILFIGASQTMFAIQPVLVEQAYREIRGDDKTAASMVTAVSNPELAYSFFRDYLAHNPAPEVAMIQLSIQRGGGRPLPFAHPLFAYLAPPYLYRRELQSWPFVNSKLFAISDFLRLVVRHIELTLNNLLTADLVFWVPAGNNCVTAPNGGVLVDDNTTESFSTLRSAEFFAQIKPEALSFGPATSFDEVMAAEAQQILPEGGWEKVGDDATLSERYADNPRLLNRMKKVKTPKVANRPPYLWYYGPSKERDAYYYRRIAELAQQHGVQLRFLLFPPILATRPTGEQLARYADQVGAPVYVLPWDYTRLTYHHYRDTIHVTGSATRLYSAWAASLIDTHETD